MPLGVSELASPHSVVTLSIDSPSQDFLKFCIDIQPDRNKTKKIDANFILSNISQIKNYQIYQNLPYCTNEKNFNVKICQL